MLFLSNGRFSFSGWDQMYVSLQIMRLLRNCKPFTVQRFCQSSTVPSYRTDIKSWSEFMLIFITRNMLLVTQNPPNGTRGVTNFLWSFRGSDTAYLHWLLYITRKVHLWGWRWHLRRGLSYLCINSALIFIRMCVHFSKQPMNEV